MIASKYIDIRWAWVCQYFLNLAICPLIKQVGKGRDHRKLFFVGLLRHLKNVELKVRLFLMSNPVKVFSK